MNGDKGSSGFGEAVEPVVRKFLENIENPFVWMPLGLFVLCVLAYPVTKFDAFLYLSIGFLLLAFGADWAGRWQNRQFLPKPTPTDPRYKDDIFRYLSGVQAKTVEMIGRGKSSAARVLIDKNLKAIDEALKAFPNDADFHALMGYTLKDIFQSSKGSLPTEQRQAYLGRARASFEHALRLDPDNAGAHNGMGNVLFFERSFDKAVKEHDIALNLTGGNYPAAEDDKRLVMRVKNGEVPFDF